MKSRRSPPVSEADAQIFRESVGRIRPLLRGDSNPSPRQRPKAAAPRLRMQAGPGLDELLGPGSAAGYHSWRDPLQFLQPGLDPGILRRLRRGECVPQDELDLHHMTAAAARTSMLHFLEEACHAGFRCVRIIHGKGLGSSMGGPVLKLLTDQLLRSHDQVLAFSSARADQGGTGAVLVWLRPQ
ncbi:Smr/MutS family protein [Frateuria aurantia]